MDGAHKCSVYSSRMRRKIPGRLEVFQVVDSGPLQIPLLRVSLIKVNSKVLKRLEQTLHKTFYSINVFIH